MSVGPYPISEVVDRLRSHAPSIKLFGTAADLGTARQQLPRTAPAIYVLSNERGRDTQFSGSITRQNIEVAVQVVCFIRHAGSADSGEGARREADHVVIPQIRTALIGWSPLPEAMGLAFDVSRDEDYETGWLCFQEVFKTNYHIQNTVTP